MMLAEVIEIGENLRNVLIAAIALPSVAFVLYMMVKHS